MQRLRSGLFLLLLCTLGCTAQQKAPAGSIRPLSPATPPPPRPEVVEAQESAPAPLLSIGAPGRGGPYDVQKTHLRPPRVAGRLDTPLRRDWRYIVIHHSGTRSGSEASFDRYHREHNGWRGVGYDFVIGNGRGSPDGLVEVTFRWEEQQVGAHAGHDLYNQHGIGICLVGNFDEGRPSPAQMEALVGLVNYLQERCDIPTVNVLGHRHVRPKHTRCPGANFPWYEFYARLRH